MPDWLTQFLTATTALSIAYFLGLSAVYFLMTALAFVGVRRHLREKDLYEEHALFQTSMYRPISLLAPAYGEEATIIESVESLLRLRYPEYEVIVINDGSPDDTLGVLLKHFNMAPTCRVLSGNLATADVRGMYRSRTYPNLVAVDKENGGKADALNAGINASRYPIFCAMDADSMIEPQSLLRLVRPFVEDERNTIAAGGIVRIVNGCAVDRGEVTRVELPGTHLGRLQVLEYLRAFLSGRMGWSVIDNLLIISGAFGLFRKDVVMEAGGYLRGTVGEDMELVVRMHRVRRGAGKPSRAWFIPDAVCWTECPEDLATLGRQRNRWQRGLLDSLMKNARMTFNPRYGLMGMFTMPYFLFFEGLGPIVEALGLLSFLCLAITGNIDWGMASLFLGSSVVLGIFLSATSVMLEELAFGRYPRIRNVLLLVVYSLLENIGYRQLNAWWRIKGVWDFFRGQGQWGKMPRKGFSTDK